VRGVVDERLGKEDPIGPSTMATCSEAAISRDVLIDLALATTSKPRSMSRFAIPAPIPREAPVTMATLRPAFMT
jgi:hypothetical protein